MAKWLMKSEPSSYGWDDLVRDGGTMWDGGRNNAALLLALSAGASAETPSWPLTPSGWGPAHIGMTRAQISSALHVQLEGDAFDNEGKCINLIASDDALPGLFFMFLDGRLSRITVT